MILAAVPLWASLVVVALLSAALTLVLLLAIRLAWRTERSQELKALARGIVVPISAINALILSLAFNDALTEYNELAEQIDEEAVAVAQLHEDFVEESDPALTESLTNELVAYLRAVIEDEWRAGSLEDLPQSGNQALERLRALMAPLKRTDPTGFAEMDALLDAIERARLQRLLDLDQSMPELFWYLAMALFLVTLIPLAIMTERPTHALLAALYGVATGLVLHGILVLSQPFNASDPISDRPMRFMLDLLVGPAAGG
jgi:hypothetical protein